MGGSGGDGTRGTYQVPRTCTDDQLTTELYDCYCGWSFVTSLTLWKFRETSVESVPLIEQYRTETMARETKWLIITFPLELAILGKMVIFTPRKSNMARRNTLQMEVCSAARNATTRNSHKYMHAYIHTWTDRQTDRQTEGERDR